MFLFSKFVNQTLHFNLEVADSNGWCIVPPVQIRSSSAAPSLRNKTRLQNWQTQRLQGIVIFIKGVPAMKKRHCGGQISGILHIVELNT
jgi:hypothetical protein